MKAVSHLFLITALLSLLAFPVEANETKQQTTPDPQLSSKYEDFMQFAQAQVKSLNRNHKFSRSRMQITELPDGTYRAFFHQIDNSELVGKVRRSRSQTVPFVGILSYQEQVFESVGKTPEECLNGDFSLVSVTPNKHIYSFKEEHWD